MRIISGKHRGKRILAPKKLPVRPTTDFAKESLFNILNNYYYFDQLDVIDLFAGTGNIGLEFASRNAKNITFVDRDNGCVRFVKKMIDEMSIENVDVIQADVFKFIQKTNAKADLIFADPPFDFEQEKIELIPNAIFENKMLNENGMLVVEHFKKIDLSRMENFSFSRKYGISIFSFFEKA